MAFSEFETKRLEKLVGAFVGKRRPPPHVRPKLDLAFRIAQQSVELFEVRPKWRGEPGETMEHAVAEAAYVRARDCWKVYRKRADLKWHGYPPEPQVSSIERSLAIVGADKHGCFFGQVGARPFVPSEPLRALIHVADGDQTSR